MTGSGDLEAVGVGRRSSFLPLLRLADESVDHVEAHLDEGELFAWTAVGAMVGAVQAVPRTPSLWELTLVAVAEEFQRRRHGTEMLTAVIDSLAARGARRIVVGTASAGVGQLAFYQRAGFRVFAVDRDHFDRARGYTGNESENGIVIRDLVWLDRLLP
ncbi:MAG TPA: GNAT family N-acetyltransferase [Acidimicrobiales bacterium]|nr:GNAT family N-acetyltransferase [Acidimicrobiales bacterium]